MVAFVPKSNPDELWVRFPAKKTFAVRMREEEGVYLRLGPAHGIYVLVNRSKSGETLVHSIDYDDGNLSVLGKLKSGERSCVGRAGECQVKILHAVVSRRHVEIKLDDPVLVIRDMGSTNGTFCHKNINFFDIDDYLAKHPIGTLGEGTLDEIHQTFGPTLDDVLRRYVESNKKKE